MKINPLSLNILYTFACNIECSHCCFFCNPKRTDKLNFDRLKKLIEEAKQYPSFKQINFSGGEVFLFADEIVELVKYASQAGFTVTCSTNGFWGRDPTYAENLLKRLRLSGLSTLSISYDVFHAEYIPKEFIEEIIRLARKSLVNIELKAIETKNPKSYLDIIKKLDVSLDNIIINPISCLPIGRAKDLFAEDIFINEPILNAVCFSIGREITVYPNGDVTPCCSPMLSPNKFNLGNIYTLSLEDIIINCEKNRDIVNLYKYGISSALNKKGSLCEFCYTTDFEEKGKEWTQRKRFK